MLVLCIFFYFMHEYKIELMEEVSLANRRGRREGDKPGRERIDEMKGLLTSEEG